MAETVILGQFLSASYMRKFKLDFALRKREKFADFFLVFEEKMAWAKINF